MMDDKIKTQQISIIINSLIKPVKFDELLELQIRQLTGSFPLRVFSGYRRKSFEMTIAKLKDYDPITVMETVFDLWNKEDLDYRLFASVYVLKNRYYFFGKGNELFIELMQKNLDSKNITLRIFIALLAGWKDNPQALPFIRRLLTDRSEFVKSEALESLVKIEKDKAVPTLVDVYKKDEDLLIRHTALRHLKKYGDEAIEPIFREALDSPSEELLAEACEYYADKNDPEITSILNEKYNEVKHILGKLATSYALYCHGHESRLREIMAFLSLGSGWFHLNVRVSAAHFLANIAESGADKDVIVKILDALEDAKEKETVDIASREIEISIRRVSIYLEKI